ncbi:hypothetical protein OG874_22250 [Nocardia sp. NBC_00565]|uniref:type IV toxin-antitoxin system AbiEi family antitoxin domain-containing protein n=1 Tax=Nocardia sp. NBC_00565 TaxID=2975993 RepID=UPI002E80A8D9|nr:hypothetical protein [Nocardia sp. NBC_00565]WUC07640.1 hypothetical protein OG874_22250 [Nocardia sp. NBC_00565]
MLFRLRYGVYRLAGVPDSPAEPIRAEWLALQPARTAGDRIGDEVPFGVVSHRSAADLQGLGDLDADYLEFTVPTRRGTRSPDVRFHRAVLTAADWTLVDGLPVTTPVRTIADLADARTDGGHLASVVRDALLRGTSVDGIADALRPYAHRYGAPVDNGSALINHFIEQAGVPESSLALTAPSLGPLVAATTAANQALNQLLHGQHSAHLTTSMTSLPATEAVVAAIRQQLAPGGELTEAIRQALAPLADTPEWRNMLTRIRTQLQQSLDPQQFPTTASARDWAIKQVREGISEALVDAAVRIPEPDRDALAPGTMSDQPDTSPEAEQ